MYRQRDVENVLHIKKLLYDEGFTIAGARQQLKDEAKPARKQSGLPFPKQKSADGIKKVRQGLQEILGILSTARKRKASGLVDRARGFRGREAHLLIYDIGSRSRKPNQL